jgi:hypothetical protein
MAELLASFSAPISDVFGVFHARAVGRVAPDNMWEGWVEFVPVDGGGQVLVSGIESRQPERAHLVYWANGLTPVYLEGALSRARRPLTVRVPVLEEPVSEAPARRVIVKRVIAGPEAILDPFEVGKRSFDILRQELTALNRPRLLNIVAAYNLASAVDVMPMSSPQLVGFIVAEVEARLSRARA